MEFDGLPGQILFPVAGLVLQDPYVQISGVRDTVFDEILFTLENLGKIPIDPRKTVVSLLQRLGIDHLAERKPTSLSGGETQCVALAAILIAQPPLLLLDEPTTALDSNAQDKLRLILRSLQGKTTVLITDTQIDFALSIADEILLLDHGTLRPCSEGYTTFHQYFPWGAGSRRRHMSARLRRLLDTGSW
jgi:energy-coupling factor transport system ATP-binding protein